MVFKLAMAAAKTWRRLKGENQLPKAPPAHSRPLRIRARPSSPMISTANEPGSGMGSGGEDRVAEAEKDEPPVELSVNVMLVGPEVMPRLLSPIVPST